MIWIVIGVVCLAIAVLGLLFNAGAAKLSYSPEQQAEDDEEQYNWVKEQTRK